MHRILLHHTSTAETWHELCSQKVLLAECSLKSSQYYSTAVDTDECNGSCNSTCISTTVEKERLHAKSPIAEEGTVAAHGE